MQNQSSNPKAFVNFGVEDINIQKMKKERIKNYLKDAGDECLAYLVLFGVFLILPTIAGLIWGCDGFLVVLFLQGWIGTFFL